MSTLGILEEIRKQREQLQILVGVLIAFIGLDVLDLLLPAAQDLARPLRWLRLIGPHWLVALVVIAVVIWVESRELSSIGLEQPGARDLGLGALGFVVGVLTFGVTRPLVRELGLASTSSGIELISSLPMWMAITIALTAGLTEEVLFRGYPIERLAELTGELWVGASITFLTFTLIHIPFRGIGGAIQIGAWTLVVTVVYVWTRNLIACMVMHIANDLFAFVVLPILFESGAIP